MRATDKPGTDRAGNFCGVPSAVRVLRQAEEIQQVPIKQA